MIPPRQTSEVSDPSELSGEQNDEEAAVVALRARGERKSKRGNDFKANQVEPRFARNENRITEAKREKQQAPSRHIRRQSVNKICRKGCIAATPYRSVRRNPSRRAFSSSSHLSHGPQRTRANNCAPPSNSRTVPKNLTQILRARVGTVHAMSASRFAFATNACSVTSPSTANHLS